MSLLALIRHGQSTWNEQEKFTGWHDVLLTTRGEKEVRKAAQKVTDIPFDLAVASELTRAKDSLNIVLEELRQTEVTKVYTHALNERDYGDLTGLTHKEAIKKYGKTQYELWHRSWDVQPPHGESLKDTQKRVLKYYEEIIMPELKKGKNVLVVASGNSLRSLVKEVEHIANEAIVSYEIPTGTVLLYRLNIKGTLEKIS